MILSFEFPLMTGAKQVMPAKAGIDPARLLEEQLADASPDLLRAMLSTFIPALMRRRRTRCAALVRDQQPGAD